MAKSDGSDNSSEGFKNNEVTLMSKKFKQMMKKKGNFQHSSRWKNTRFKKKHKEKSNKIIYFECRKPIHMKAECPQLKGRDTLVTRKRKV